MSYKDTYTKLNVVHELLVNRYMLTVLLTNTYNLIELLNAKEKRLSFLLDEQAQKKIKKDINISNVIQFNNFNLTSKQYEILVNEYGHEVIADACVILDKYIETSGRNIKSPYKKLKEWAVNLAMKERISQYNSTICQAITAIDYHDIDNRENALKYIQGTPFYMRNVDAGCKYLKEKFNL